MIIINYSRKSIESVYLMLLIDVASLVSKIISHCLYLKHWSLKRNVIVGRGPIWTQIDGLWTDWDTVK